MFNVQRILQMVGLSGVVLVLGCNPDKPKPIAAGMARTPEVTSPRGDGTAKATEAAINLRVASRPEYDAVIAGHKGKVVLVDFWATYCVPCRKQFPHTVELSRTLGDLGLRVVSVSCDGADKHDAAQQFLQKSEARFDNLNVGSGWLHERIGIES